MSQFCEQGARQPFWTDGLDYEPKIYEILKFPGSLRAAKLNIHNEE